MTILLPQYPAHNTEAADMASLPVRDEATLIAQATRGNSEAYITLLGIYRPRLITYAMLQITDNRAIEEHANAVLADAVTAQRSWRRSGRPLDEWLILQLNARLSLAGFALDLAGTQLYRHNIDSVAPELPLRSVAILLMLNAVSLSPASIAAVLGIDVTEVRATSRAFAQARLQQRRKT